MKLWAGGGPLAGRPEASHQAMLTVCATSATIATARQGKIPDRNALKCCVDEVVGRRRSTCRAARSQPPGNADSLCHQCHNRHRAPGEDTRSERLEMLCR